MNAKQLKNAILQLAIQGKLVPPACRLAGKTRPTSQLPTEETGVWYVYVIECEDGSFYKGFTTNLQKRYKEHCSGRGAEWTKKHKPKQLYYYEIQYSEEAALKREKYLKSGSGREWFKREVVDKSDDWEPASVLLAQIRKEKEQLVKAGKLKSACRQAGKKDLETIPITDEEKPFEIPESWEWCRWGDLSFSIQYGYNASAQVAGDIRMVRISDIQNNEVLWDTVPFCKIKADEIDTYILEENDILFARTGGTVGKSFLVKEVPYPAIYAGYLIRTRYSKNLIPKYLKSFMESSIYWDQLRDGTIATAQPNCNGKTLSKMLIPLPPLAEQHRIVAKIEELMPLVEEYGAAQEKLNRLNEALPEALKKSILQQAIQGKLVPQDANDEPASALLARIRKEKEQLVKAGKLKPACRQAGKKDLATTPITDEEKPFEIPESWEWVHFEDIAQGLTGKTPERGNQEYWSNVKYPWVSISDMTDYGHVKYTKEAVSEKATKIMRDISTKGSLLMSFKLTVGRTSILDIDAYHNEAIITVKPYIDNSNILRDFLFRFLPLITEDGDTKDAIKGRTLNAKSIASLPIPLPPLSEQKRIVTKIEELMAMVEGMEREEKEI